MSNKDFVIALLVIAGLYVYIFCFIPLFSYEINATEPPPEITRQERILENIVKELRRHNEREEKYRKDFEAARDEWGKGEANGP